jgi:uncharacterized protein (DUF934 family)
MPLLDRMGEIEDVFDGRNPAYVLVSLADLPATLDAAPPSAHIGVRIPNTVRAAGLAPHFNRLALIAVEFPAFTDGRGFSQGQQLRNLGFRGRLRAVGPLIADQFAYALACGFEEIEAPQGVLDRAPVQQWRAALSAISHGYQRGRGDALNILDQRRRAREAAHG